VAIDARSIAAFSILPLQRAKTAVFLPEITKSCGYGVKKSALLWVIFPTHLC
jgi:uncharacterized membrane protein